VSTRRTGRRTNQSRQRRSYAWIPSSTRVVTTAAATTNGAGDLLANYNADVGAQIPISSVIERIIGYLWFRTAAPAGEVEFTAGIRLVDEASTVFPVLDTEIARWLWWYGGVASGAYESGAGAFQPTINHVAFDVHGRWRINDIGDELTMRISNHAPESALVWSLWTRTLVRVG